MAYAHARLLEMATQALASKPSLSLSGVAKLLRVHRHTLCSIIQSRTQVPAKVWRDHQALAKLCTCFDEHPDWSIKEIASELGYSSSSALDRFTKRLYGMTPTELRLRANLGARNINVTAAAGAKHS